MQVLKSNVFARIPDYMLQCLLRILRSKRGNFLQVLIFESYNNKSKFYCGKGEGKRGWEEFFSRNFGFDFRIILHKGVFSFFSTGELQCFEFCFMGYSFLSFGKFYWSIEICLKSVFLLQENVHLALVSFQYVYHEIIQISI